MTIRLTLVFLLLAGALGAAVVKLYLTDGTYQKVREYEVVGNRVRFYTVERSEWEEIPLDLVDLERTKNEIKQREEATRTEQQFWDREEAAERERRREIASVPQALGAYLVDGDKMMRLPRADLDVLTDKKKQFLKIITPVPMIAGRKDVIIRGLHAEMVVTTPTPEFYLRLYREERFGIIRLGRKKKDRHVESWAVAPVTNMVYEEHENLPVFRREVGDNLYKIWPKEPLEPGEYAVVEFSIGEANVQAWDFGYWPSGAPPKE